MPSIHEPATKVTSAREVQVITAAATASDLDGYFFIGFEGHWSEKIAYDATSDDMASALAGIPAVGEVEVMIMLYIMFRWAVGGLRLGRHFRCSQMCLFLLFWWWW